MSTSKQPNTNNVLFAVIIGLLVVIAVLAFFVGKNMSGGTTPSNPTVTTGEGIEVTIIDDKRCTTCGTDQIVSQLKQVPFLAQANFIDKDFSDSGVEDILKANSIATLPAVIFNTNALNDGGQMSSYLVALSDGTYSLQIGSTFDPFVERSEKGFLVLEQDKLQDIKEGAYIKGNSDAKISWIEYSDLECPFCARLHNAPTIGEVFDKYGDSLNMAFQHFPLNFHPNAKPGAEVLECFGEQNGSEAFYSLIEASFSNENSDTDFLIDEAVKLGGSKEAIQACLDEKKFSKKVDNQMVTGQTLFGVTGTPGNVLINNETGEYEVISGAYPTESFIDVIDRLLK